MEHKLLLVLLSIALVSPSVSAAKGGKPPPIPQPNHVMWVDANGVMLGDAQQRVVPGEYPTIYFEINEKLYYAELRNGVFWGYNLYYDLPDCLGNAYSSKSVEDGVYILNAIRDGIYYVSDGTASQQLTMQSTWSLTNGGSCNNFSKGGPFLPAVPFLDTNIYTKPYQLKLIPAK